MQLAIEHIESSQVYGLYMKLARAVDTEQAEALTLRSRIDVHEFWIFYSLHDSIEQPSWIVLVSDGNPQILSDEHRREIDLIGRRSGEDCRPQLEQDICRRSEARSLLFKSTHIYPSGLHLSIRQWNIATDGVKARFRCSRCVQVA